MKKKTILITGATSGIGEALARVLASKDYVLIIAGRRRERLEALSKEFDNAHVLKLDITNSKSITQALESLPGELKVIDVLVNNAGVEIGLETLDNKQVEDIDTIIATNVTGTVHLTNTILKQMKAQGYGHIINIGSLAAYTPYSGGNVYGGTKAFIRQFSRNLRMELVGTGIRVSNIEPGSTRTELAVGINNYDEEKAFKHYDHFNPLEPEDVANTIAWCIEQPERVNIDNIEILPTDQVFGGIATNLKS